MNIYDISPEQGTVPAKLVLLHEIPTPYTPSLLSAPFVGSHCTYLFGPYKNAFRRITIDHNRDSLPTVEILGKLPKPVNKECMSIQLGPAESVVFRSKKLLEFISYENAGDCTRFQRKIFHIPQQLHYHSIRSVTAFDDLTGRVVLWMTETQKQLLVMDVM